MKRYTELWNLPHTSGFGTAPGAQLDRAALGASRKILEEVPEPEKAGLRDQIPHPSQGPASPLPARCWEGLHRLGSASEHSSRGRRTQALLSSRWVNRAGKFTKVGGAASSSSFFPGEVDESIPSKRTGPLASGAGCPHPQMTTQIGTQNQATVTV